VLAKFAYKDAGQALGGALDRWAPGLALQAVEAIAAHRDARFVEGLSRLSGTSDEKLARAVADALGKRATPEARRRSCACSPARSSPSAAPR
jgi:hypothetical protein